MSETKERINKACPTLHELANRIEDAITLLNEIKADYNAEMAAVTAKLNEVIARTENLATKYTAHIAEAAHPDATNTLTGSAVTTISTTANLVTSKSVDPI
jgi:enoyl reductase-like protein